MHLCSAALERGEQRVGSRIERERLAITHVATLDHRDRLDVLVAHRAPLAFAIIAFT